MPKRIKSIADLKERLKASAAGEGNPWERKLASQQRLMASARKAARDIAPGFDPREINWERRLACRENLRLFCETYLEAVFYLKWSNDQLRCIEKIERVFLEGGMFALAMPRGGGKTALCRAAIVWGTLYAHRRFPYFVGSSHEKAKQSLNAIKTILFRNLKLRQDFPEVCYPVYRLENRPQMARSQLFNGEPTHIEWGSESVRYPSLLLNREQADQYLRHCSESVRYIEEYQAYLPLSAGVFIATSGIDGSIRGEAEVHPITLEQPRPDVVLLDDVQKDQKAESPASCDKITRLIDGAIQGLAGPGKQIAALMPCTVIREGDVADRFLNPDERPEWQGERCRMVLSWPPGITDYEITNETEEGRLWNRYAEKRMESLRKHKDIRLATRFYKKHKRKMDNGFRVSWPERYIKEGANKELSAQQHAMNLRLKSPEAFLAEFQNIGRRETNDSVLPITAEQLRRKTIDFERYELPPEVQYVVAFIDVQNEILFYTVLGVAPDFTGVVADYGTWPRVTAPYFTKSQTEGWSLLTAGFFKAYPKYRNKAVRDSSGRLRAPLEAKIYWALTQAVDHLTKLRFTRRDEHKTKLEIRKIGIDTRWGQASEVIKRFIRESPHRKILVPYYGQAVPPTNKQFEEYTRTRGWLFEDQINRLAKEVRWIMRPAADGTFYMAADVNRLKDFLFSRLATPPGASGSISLFKAPPDQHEMFADHICRSEYPEPVTARGLTKNLWKPRDGRPDNDYLDCIVGCLAMASLCGAAIETKGRVPRRRVAGRRRGGKRLSEIWQRRR